MMIGFEVAESYCKAIAPVKEGLNIKKTRTLPPMKNPPGRCPKCGSESVLRIQYGLPSEALLESSESGDVFFGGCCISSDQPSSACQKCGSKW
jgi:hypothetical protein